MYIIIYGTVLFMPIIRISSDLRNNYKEISTICHQTKRPVYITKNDAGDLAVMSIELYKEIEKGIKFLDNGETYISKEVYEELEEI